MGLIEIPFPTSEGETNVGANGGATIVVKLENVENALDPPAFEALTRQ